MTADDGEHIDPEAARKIKDDSYVDDNVSGGTAEEVSRMMGKKLPDGTFSGTMVISGMQHLISWGLSLMFI